MKFLEQKHAGAVHRLGDAGFYRILPAKLAPSSTPRSRFVILPSETASIRPPNWEDMQLAAPWFEEYAKPTGSAGNRSPTARQVQDMIQDRLGVEVSLGAVIQAAHDAGFKIQAGCPSAHIGIARKTIEDHEFWAAFKP